jgi:multisubunit Na+/H+ antiporter MnhE subunit
MFHAAAMLIGLAAVWLLYAQRSSMGADAALAFGVAAACVLLTLRFGGVERGFLQAPARIGLALARAGAVMRGALSTMRAAIAADVTLAPALVRVKTRATSAQSRAAFADMISAAPGMMVVESDADGFLAHVLNEDAVDTADLGRLEARVLNTVGERSER